MTINRYEGESRFCIQVFERETNGADARECNSDSRLRRRKRGKTGRKEADHGRISVSSHTCSANWVTSDFWLQKLISRWGKGTYTGDRSTLVFFAYLALLDIGTTDGRP